jgi:uncharacterized BrkB/YihY/UPF0761 family membrane protein
MDQAETKLNKIKRSSRNTLIVDVSILTVLFSLFMIFIRHKAAQIFKEMNTPTTLFHKILLEAHPIMPITGFLIIIAILIVKERLIKNKTVTYFINSFMLIALIVSIVYFGLCIFFLPLYDAPITSLK